MDAEIGNSFLTIVVPVHNMSGRLTNLSKWLDEADSNNVKVILVHDQSQDATGAELLELLEKKNSRNFLLLETNVQSPGMARNRALEMVATPWFSFADSDDLVQVLPLLQLMRECIDSNCQIGIGSYLSINLRTGDEHVICPPQIKEHSLELHLANKMGLWRFVLSSSHFGDIRFTDHKMGEDYFFTSLLLDRSIQILTSPKIVYWYFHSGNLNLTSNHSVMRDMLGVIEALKNLRLSTSNASAFRVLAIQKLTLSVIRNLSLTERIFQKSLLFLSLFFHPIYFFNLLISLKRIGL